MGISKGKGIAWAKRRLGRGGRVFVLTGDGELQEGQNYEALLNAARQGVPQLTVIVDHNKLQTDKTVAEISDLGDLEARFRTYGWTVLRCDGHSWADLERVFDELRRPREVPAIVIADTIKGRGVSFMEHPRALADGRGLYRWHAGAPDDESFARASDELMARVRARFERMGLGAVAVEELAPEAGPVAGRRAPRIRRRGLWPGPGGPRGAPDRHRGARRRPRGRLPRPRLRGEVSRPLHRERHRRAGHGVDGGGAGPDRAAAGGEQLRELPGVARQRADLQQRHRAVEGHLRLPLRRPDPRGPGQVAPERPGHLAVRRAARPAPSSSRATPRRRGWRSSTWSSGTTASACCASPSAPRPGASRCRRTTRSRPARRRAHRGRRHRRAGVRPGPAARGAGGRGDDGGARRRTHGRRTIRGSTGWTRLAGGLVAPVPPRLRGGRPCAGGRPGRPCRAGAWRSTACSTAASFSRWASRAIRRAARRARCSAITGSKRRALAERLLEGTAAAPGAQLARVERSILWRRPSERRRVAAGREPGAGDRRRRIHRHPPRASARRRGRRRDGRRRPQRPLRAACPYRHHVAPAPAARSPAPSLVAEGRFDRVYHLAGAAYVPPSIEDPAGDLGTTRRSRSTCSRRCGAGAPPRRCSTARRPRCTARRRCCRSRGHADRAGLALWREQVRRRAVRLALRPAARAPHGLAPAVLGVRAGAAEAGGVRPDRQAGGGPDAARGHRRGHRDEGLRVRGGRRRRGR